MPSMETETTDKNRIKENLHIDRAIFLKQWNRLDALKTMSILLVLGSQYILFTKGQIVEDMLPLAMGIIAKKLEKILGLKIDRHELYKKLTILEQLHLVKISKISISEKTSHKRFSIDRDGLIWYPFIMQLYLSGKQAISKTYSTLGVNDEKLIENIQNILKNDKTTK